MIPVLTAAESSRLDSESTTPVEVLMDRAGRHVARIARNMGVGYGSKVAVLAGPGNNGGDGYVAARDLRLRGVDVAVQALTDPRTEVAAAARRSAEGAGVIIREMGKPHDVDLVIDAVFGGGFRRGVPSELVPWMSWQGPIISVDIPSGLDPDTGTADEHVFNATRTVAFHSLKPGHLLVDGPDHCGMVDTVDIGLEGGDPALEVVTSADSPLPPRDRRDHKWSVGSVLVVGGSAGMTGASVLAARSALHFGAGAAAVLSPERETVAMTAPELLTYDVGQLDETIAKYDVVVVGPGLEPNSNLIAKVIDKSDRIVVDAGALEVAVQQHPRRGETILTPHAGEFARVTDHLPTYVGAAALASDLGATVLLKGSPTIVAAPDAIPALVRSGGPELASIGTGDVLSGMIGALWARGLDGPIAARSAAFWHGVAAADMARSRTVTSDHLAVHVGGFAHER